MNRIFDIVVSIFIILIVALPLALICLVVFLQDFHSPLYFGRRVSKNGKVFNLIKIRSMVHDAERSGVESTSSRDIRITKFGHIIRKYKLDEFGQFLNVLQGNMSIVGPRPNTQKEVQKYSEFERLTLTVNPGITDLSSIIFADEGEILMHYSDPEVAYNKYIRPFKAELGVLYLRNKSLLLDIHILIITGISFFNRQIALRMVKKSLLRLGAPFNLIRLAGRCEPLENIIKENP